MKAKWKLLRDSRVRMVVRFLQRHRWLFPLLSFVAGVGSFILVERGEALATVIAITVLAGWLVVLTEPLLSRLIKRFSGLEAAPTAIRFIAQAAHQEAFFFAIPFFAFATVWASGQVVFVALLTLAAVISVLDPVYFDRLSQHRAWFLAYHAFAIFVTVLTTLPIIFKLETGSTYLIATTSVAFLALPSLFNFGPPEKSRPIILLAVAFIVSALAWFAKPFVPPATLAVTTARIAQSVDVAERAVSSARWRLDLDEISSGLYAYTAIRAPLGLHEEVYHVWRQDGREIDRILLSIRGERKAGFRTWSYKEHFGQRPQGAWQVDVETAGGQRLGVVRFMIE